MDGAEKPINIVNSTPESRLYQYKLGIERITEDLTKFGLTKTQAKVFIYLGKYGSKTSPEVSKDLKLPRTETYHILNMLTNRGIVITEFSHPTKFSAIKMEKAIKIMVKIEQVKIGMLAEKEKEITNLWNKIPSFFTPSSKNEYEKFQMLQGSPRIHSKMKNMISNAKDGCKLLCGAKDLSRFNYSNLLEDFDSPKLNSKLIVSSEAVIPELLGTMNTSKIKALPHTMARNQCFLIKDDAELLIFLRNANFPAKEIFAFWTDSKSLIESIKLLFNYSWKSSKPIVQTKLIIPS
ncbi:MAG TPA: helix-turn-helix domain-containing protein [Nitrosopumilaceae archaeon]|nr:helix-turn-helix domain-containing protein [Nitrosopumilaceae archaeon]